LTSALTGVVASAMRKAKDLEIKPAY